MDCVSYANLSTVFVHRTQMYDSEDSRYLKSVWGLGSRWASGEKYVLEIKLKKDPGFAPQTGKKLFKITQNVHWVFETLSIHLKTVIIMC
jgi:hypothetical protein